MLNEQMIKEDNCIGLNDCLIVGVSGGPDSMGLLHFLISIQSKYNLSLFVAHINHHTRKEENQKEELMIRDYCDKHHIPFYVGHFRKSGSNNFHEEARNYRYNFFVDLTKKLNANKIVLAHHEDDQIETILFKITRGSHINGYLGMKNCFEIEKNITVVRPFLDVKKSEIIDYCETNQVPYAIDSSNLTNKYTRNHIRNRIIPLFKEIQPDFNHKIMQFHDQLSEVDDFLKQNAKILMKEMIISSEKDRIILDLNKLRNTHIALIRVILLAVVNEVYQDPFYLTYEKVKNLLNIINNNKPNVTFDLGKNLYCVKEYDKLIFEVGQREYEEYELVIDEFKDYELPNGMKLRVKKLEEKAKINNKSLILCYNRIIWPFVVRTRKQGDFIKTKIGRKKVNRLFIDAKIPINLRKTWPLLVDKDGNILWVIGIQKYNFNQYTPCDEMILIEVLN
ncbi:tRNA lysidine(34) synthetase TilS [Mycoplasmatota bacterium]|nr:tRNA lysidine(34) synthetase TilS [Mycoplasmatota bacterium]